MNFESYTAHHIEELSQWGVYAIVNKLNHKFYIGSAQQEGEFPSQTGFYARFSKHVERLTKNKHHCKHLQNAWNKYGADNFEFKIIHKCHPDDCIQFEQLYLNFLCPHYNSSPTAGCTKGVKRTAEWTEKQSQAQSKDYYLINPQGEVVIGRNLSKLAEEFNLDHKAICRVNLGKSFHCNGWTASLEAHTLYKEHFESRGIRFEKSRSKWLVEINYNNQRVKRFNTKEEAFEYRNTAIENGCIIKVNVCNWKKKLKDAKENS